MPSSARGFTLVEMLVVLAIMGMLIGLVTVLSRPDDRALLRVEAERLAQLLDLAATEARVSGKAHAWVADAAGYGFQRLGADGWTEIRDVDQLRARKLPQGISIAGLRTESMRPAAVSGAPGQMRLQFRPQGDTTAYMIGMAFGSERYAIAASPLGEIQVVPGDGGVRANAGVL